MTQPESIVHEMWPQQIELPDANSYAHFHEIYGQPEDTRTRTGLLLARALRVENPNEHVHVAVRESNDAWYNQQMVYENVDEAFHKIPYHDTDFLVVTFNGLKTQWWNVSQAHGRHYEQGAYRDESEVIHLNLQDQHSEETARIRFFRASGVGAMSILGSHRQILDTQETLGLIHTLATPQAS